MDKFILDDHSGERLLGIESQVELCNASGQTIGFFWPVELHERMMQSLLGVPVTDAELAFARAQTGGRELSAILADLSRR